MIGSGATAVTLVPALAETAAHVTMVQRSPSYIVSRPSRDGLADRLRRWLPLSLADKVTRWKNVLLGMFFFSRARKAPAKVRAKLLELIARDLPGHDLARDFTPSYNPWDQRVCLVPDGDLFAAMRGRQGVDRHRPDRALHRDAGSSSNRASGSMRTSSSPRPGWSFGCSAGSRSRSTARRSMSPTASTTRA